MTSFRRALIAAVSMGWIAPLSMSFYMEHYFVSRIVWPWLTSNKHWAGSFHPLYYADSLFYFAMLWLAAVIGCWTWRLTDEDDS